MTKRYSDREVRLILQRAVEPAASPPATEPGGEDGLSLDQIKDIGAEVGIDTKRIELAASSLLETTPAAPNAYAGIPTTVQFQTVIPGLRIDDVSRHDVLALIRNTLGRHGIVDHGRDSLDWKARDGFGGRYVSITPAPEGVRLRIMGNYRDGLIGFSAGLGVIIFGVVAAVLKGSFGIESTPIILGGGGLAGLIPPRFAYRWWRKQEDTTMADLHRRLVALLTESGSAAPALEPPDDRRQVD